MRRERGGEESMLVYSKNRATHSGREKRRSTLLTFVLSLLVTSAAAAAKKCSRTFLPIWYFFYKQTQKKLSIFSCVFEFNVCERCSERCSGIMSTLPRIQYSINCSLCGCNGASYKCTSCNSMSFCDGCDAMYHRHPKRRSHVRQPLSKQIVNIFNIFSSYF